MTKIEADHLKQHIEVAIERARDGVGERIDAIDKRLRSSLDFKQIAADHAPQLLATGAAIGFLIGFGAPRVITRAVQLGIPLAIAIQIVKKRRAASDQASLT